MRRIIQTFSLSILLALPVFAQENVVLEYYDNPDGFDITQTKNLGFETTKYAGMNLLPGDTIVNDASHVELRFENTGSIILLRKLSTLEYESNTASGNAGGTLNMTRGTMRIRAESDSRFSISSANATARFSEGDYILDYSNPNVEQWYVLGGEIQIITKASGVTSQVSAGNSGKLSPQDTVSIVPLDSSEITALESLYRFTWLSQVAGAPVYVEPSKTDTPEVIPEPVIKGPVQKTNQTENVLFQWTPLSEKEKKLRGGINFDIGTDTLLDNTYISLSVRPNFSIKRFSMEFYLPLQFNANILAGYDAFILPNGNMEWSFGSDYNWQTDTFDAAMDALDDLASKIHFIRFATLADPVFVYAGHIENITLSHGLLVSKFDNNPRYPALRNMGLLTSIDLSYWGLQFLTDDVTNYPSMYIVRTFTRPMARKYRFEIGLTAGIDFGLSANDYTGKDGAETSITENGTFIQSAKDSKIGFFMFGADLKLPLINPRNPLTPLALVAETSFLMPFSNSNGLQFISNNTLFQGWPDIAAILVGFSGELADKSWFHMAYQFDVRYHGFLFVDRLINANYTISGRYDYSKIWGAIIDTPSILDGDATTLGISASVEMLFFNSFALDTLFWIPLDFNSSSNNGSLAFGMNDRFEIGLSFKPEDFFISIGASFQRRNFLTYFLKPDGYDSTNFLDSDTTINGNITFSFGSTKLALLGSTAVETNDEGAIPLDTNGFPINGGSISLKVSFGI